MSDGPSPFHRGETEIQVRLGVADEMEERGRRIIRDRIPEENLPFFAQLPLITIATVDECGRAWASALTGLLGFACAIDPHALEVRARPVYGDALNKTLVEGADIGVLGLDFESRGRFRVNGTIARLGEDGFKIRVRQAFPNCPRYIQARACEPGGQAATVGERKAVVRGGTLNRTEAALIAGSDTLFIASQFAEDGEGTGRTLDVSHRGGNPGFVIVAHESLLLFPDYSGNCMFPPSATSRWIRAAAFCSSISTPGACSSSRARPRFCGSPSTSRDLPAPSAWCRFRSSRRFTSGAPCP